MISQLKISDFDYDLPEARIAPYPAPERDMSKLLVYKGNMAITHDSFRHIVNYLEKNCLLVCNNTRVIHARLLFTNETGGHVEIFCLRPVDPPEYETAFKVTGECVWECLIGNLRRWKSGFIKRTIIHDAKKCELKAGKLSKTENGYHIRFSWSDSALTFGELIEMAGIIPLPPYIKRQPVEADNIRYQTVYARNEGSVAAPTAGLHFTEDILQQLQHHGICNTALTLHVGAGTFLPVNTALITDHSMHAEQFSISRSALEILLNHSGPKIAVGTTSLRTLESLFWLGIKLKQSSSAELSLDQWEPYQLSSNTTARESLESLVNFLVRHNMTEFTATTRIMIVPGYRFRIVDQLVTNFHQPRSTLLLLIAAFIGEDWKKVYEYALANEFRFLSYGDGSLLIPGEGI